MSEGPKGLSRVAVIKRYFGDRGEGQSSGDWMKEFNALSIAERHELAVGAAKELGLTQDECAFAFDLVAV